VQFNCNYPSHPISGSILVNLLSLNTSEINIYCLSSDKEDMGTKVSVTGLTDVAVQTSQLCPGKYVAAAYDNDWYIGCIIAYNDEECDILVQFMERKG
jgi:hypothetical protein